MSDLKWSESVIVGLFPDFFKFLNVENSAKPLSMMAFVKPGQGKSSLNIEFRHYLASQHNKKVLLWPMKKMLQEKLKRLKPPHENFYISEELPKSLKGFDFVFMDKQSGINSRLTQNFTL